VREMIDSGGIGKINGMEYLKSIQKKEKVSTEKVKKAEENLFTAEKLELSSSLSMKEILKQSESIPEVREELVGKFRKAIEDGIYKPDPDRIVNKLLG